MSELRPAPLQEVQGQEAILQFIFNPGKGFIGADVSKPSSGENVGFVCVCRALLLCVVAQSINQALCRASIIHTSLMCRFTHTHSLVHFLTFW